MKLAVFNLEPWEKEYLQEEKQIESLGFEVTYIDHYLAPEFLPIEKDFDAICVFVDSVVDKQVIESFPNLKFIATRSTGFDHIDLTVCKERGIAVSTVPSYGETTVAEFAFALILSLSRKLYQAVDQIKERSSFDLEPLRGFDLEGKTIGVVGTGKIGKNAIRIAKGFNMKVIAFDAFPDVDYAREAGFEYKSLDEVLAASDIITLHVPYMNETHHLINQTNVEKIKKGALLINTSRGPVVETAALLKALQAGTLAGAGLDVLEEEGVVKDEQGFLARGIAEGHDLKTIIADHVLIDMPNVLITPHNAFNTWEGLKRILDTTADNVKSFAGGGASNNVAK